jgi:hypothetical protein
VELVVRGAIPRADADAARAYVAGLGRHVDGPPVAARLALDAIAAAGFRQRCAARAQLVVGGRELAARAVAPSAARAAEIVADRLRRQLQRLAGSDIATRNEPRVIEGVVRDLVGDRRPPPHRRVKPAGERSIVPRHTYAAEPEPTLSAIADLLDLDEEFHLFSHARSGEDVVVHWRDDRRIGLLFPPGSVLADERDIVVPRPSRYSRPLALEEARAEMDVLMHRFLYFVDAGDERGRVLYLRLDGDYGLVQPW